jgi:hypothetical protein
VEILSHPGVLHTLIVRMVFFDFSGVWDRPFELCGE